MATDQQQALAEIQKQRDASVKQQFGNLPNAFVNEVKATALFQANWGELLSAAPTALSIMGTSWIIASSPIAESISLEKAKPTGGFLHIPNRPEPTLRSCLVDVCNNGGYKAFTVAGSHMDALQITSKRIVDERIPLVFQRLPAISQSEEALQDFSSCLESLQKDAEGCAKLAKETREAFSNWGLMIGELQATTESTSGSTAREAMEAKIAIKVEKISKSFAEASVEETKAQVISSADKLKRAEKRLDAALDNVPGPWSTVVGGAVTAFAQAIPSIIGGAIGSSRGFSGNGGQAAPPAGQSAAPTSSSTTVADPSYAAATAFQPLITHIYEFLGGDDGKIDWTKFDDSKGQSTGEGDKKEVSGASYLVATLNGQLEHLEKSSTDANKKLAGAYTSAIKVAVEIQQIQKSFQKDFKADVVPETTVKQWKADIKKAKSDVLELAAVAGSMSTSNVPMNMVPNVNKVDVPKVDLSAQNAQLRTAVSVVEIQQNAVDFAQSSYEKAVEKQSKSAAALAAIEKNLESLNSKTLELDEIKKVLRDAISVLVDLTIQIHHLENFFIMLSTVVTHILVPRAEDFQKNIKRVGRAASNPLVKIADIDKQTLLVATLQLKAYFSLLSDIASMYTKVHREYILRGIDMCTQLSNAAAVNSASDKAKQELSTYTAQSAEAVRKLVNEQQEKMMEGLKSRADKALEGTEAIEQTLKARNLAVDQTAKQAIQAGAATAKIEATVILASRVSFTASDSENASMEGF